MIPLHILPLPPERYTERSTAVQWLQQQLQSPRLYSTEATNMIEYEGWGSKRGHRRTMIIAGPPATSICRGSKMATIITHNLNIIQRKGR